MEMKSLSNANCSWATYADMFDKQNKFLVSNLTTGVCGILRNLAESLASDRRADSVSWPTSQVVQELFELWNT